MRIAQACPHTKNNSDKFFLYITYQNSFLRARVAQLVEHSTDTRVVPGSIPGTRTQDVISKFNFSVRVE